MTGDPSYLERKLGPVLPTAANYNVYLDNGYRTYLLAGSRTPVGERVSSGTSFAPSWSPAYVSTDFTLYSDLPGTPMRVTAWPLYHGRLLDDASYVAAGDMEADADADGVPDSWRLDAGATGAREVSGSFVWRLDRGSAGRAAYAGELVAADAGTGLQVSARIEGAAACVRFSYLDEALAAVEVGGVTAECVATLALASPGTYQTVTGRRFLAASDVAFVRVELVLTEAGSSRFDDVVVRPVARATTANAVELPLQRSAASTYTGSQQAGATGYDTGVSKTLAVDARWRGQPLTGNVTYATTAATMLPVVWTSAVAGRDASTFSASASAVKIGDGVTFTFDFGPYAAALATEGVALTSPQATVRVYGPVLAPAGNVTLLATLPAPAGALSGAVAYTHPANGLYGPLLAVASLESGWTKGGHADVTGQAAHLPLLVEALKRDGGSAVPPLYRVVVETWFPEW